jgi:hypothetical protein
MAYLKGLFVVLMISVVFSLKYNPTHDTNEVHELSGIKFKYSLRIP